MKLYYFPVAPNPTKVLVYLREKGLDMETVHVDLRQGEQKSPEHLARNPRGALPVLELDDGSCVCESLPIMEYLEELYPEPCMIGRDPLARLRVREFERQVELTLLGPVGRIVHATNSPLGLPPNPAVAKPEQDRLPAALRLVDERIGDNRFAAGDSPSIVDCTLFATLFFGEFFGVTVPDEYANLRRWYADFRQRPSAQFS